MRPQPLAAAFAVAAATVLCAGPGLAAPKHLAAKPHAASPKTHASAPAADAAPPAADAPSADQTAPAADATPPPVDNAASAGGEPAASNPVVTDMRCIVVAAALLASDDEQVKSLGRANLFYYMGRLQGRGDMANIDARILEQADKMTEADINAQSKTCGGMFTGANQALQDLSNTFAKHFAAPKK